MPAQLIANFLKLGVTHLITIDLHSDKIERFFNIPVSNLKPIELYLPFLQNYKNCIIGAPDKGSINKVETIGNLLNIDLAYITKERDVNNSCNMVEITRNVESRNCILIDDIIDSSETIYKAANYTIETDDLSSKFHIIPILPILVKELKNII
ncbi:MAG TPA: hypothetical protein LFV90_04170 [Rickettsia endosymbiont of Columbicola hoogstraali]|nr:hypothetical protein [Rickettsia endosymbiont of Columbicola hoogstraali]